jgi:hypothetical protein
LELDFLFHLHSQIDNSPSLSVFDLSIMLQKIFIVYH